MNNDKQHLSTAKGNKSTAVCRTHRTHKGCETGSGTRYRFATKATWESDTVNSDHALSVRPRAIESLDSGHRDINTAVALIVVTKNVDADLLVIRPKIANRSFDAIDRITVARLVPRGRSFEKLSPGDDRANRPSSAPRIL